MELAEAQRGLVEAMAARWVIGTPDQARRRIAELAATYGVDEVMVNPVVGGPRGHRPGPQPGPRGDAAAAWPA